MQSTQQTGEITGHFPGGPEPLQYLSLFSENYKCVIIHKPVQDPSKLDLDHRRASGLNHGLHCLPACVCCAWEHSLVPTHFLTICSRYSQRQKEATLETGDNEHILSTRNRDMLEGWLVGLESLNWKSYQSKMPFMQLKATEKLVSWAD